MGFENICSAGREGLDTGSCRQIRLEKFKPMEEISRLNIGCLLTWRVLLHVGLREGLANSRSIFFSKELGRAVEMVCVKISLNLLIFELQCWAKGLAVTGVELCLRAFFRIKKLSFCCPWLCPWRASSSLQTSRVLYY